MKSFRRVQGSTGSADLRYRLALAREPKPRDAGGPPLRRLLAETQVVIEPVRRLARNLEIAEADNPRKVMLLPGFATHPVRMRYMARQLERAGHKVKRWGLGFNFGPTLENFEILERRLEELYRRYQEPVYLVGWSLGGLFARELARRHPEMVAKVVTMGSPFSGNPRANNAWRIYQFITGHSVDSPPIAGDAGSKPPVFTTALWSPRDGIVSPRSACGKAGERDRAVALRCTHLGFAYSEESIRAVLRELDEG
ncbi:esterase/lipase family protein [Allopontixanthobacter sp.]|uniref:esterase/lipase family protein n=1 Tax=Allopontixanthobacter sp. TaxID=2906452 RepID=UPI002ABCAE71|nr:alpha/beta fold hydrolase [Allopontixanthobacter sp.]MDZ4308212.1 alpha/beta fold hydrolase [Allopontixanthobacter sp.]